MALSAIILQDVLF